jgi:hypothetical protein
VSVPSSTGGEVPSSTGGEVPSSPPVEDGTDTSSETSAFNTQTPGKYPEDNLSLQISLIMYSKNVAVSSKIHTKHINSVCRQNVEFCNVKLGCT